MQKGAHAMTPPQATHLGAARAGVMQAGGAQVLADSRAHEIALIVGAALAMYSCLLSLKLFLQPSRTSLAAQPGF